MKSPLERPCERRLFFPTDVEFMRGGRGSGQRAEV